MKPTTGKETSAATDIEEVCLEHAYDSLGLLIAESRLPNQTNKGRREGVHTPSLPTNVNHRACNPSSEECSRVLRYKSTISQLCRNDIPLCIEVLLCPLCEIDGKFTCHQVGAGQGDNYILLEQWTIQLVHYSHRDQPAQNIQNLIQAVRSHLCFSQLSAWLQSSHGVSPYHVFYRLTAPGEWFVHKFVMVPQEHKFSQARISGPGRQAVKVSLYSLPRMMLSPRDMSLANRDKLFGGNKQSTISHTVVKSQPPDDDETCTLGVEEELEKISLTPNETVRTRGCTATSDLRNHARTTPSDLVRTHGRSKSVRGLQDLADRSRSNSQTREEPIRRVSTTNQPITRKPPAQRCLLYTDSSNHLKDAQPPEGAVAGFPKISPNQRVEHSGVSSGDYTEAAEGEKSAAEMLAAFDSVPTQSLNSLTLISCTNKPRQAAPNRITLIGDRKSMPLKSPKVLFTSTSSLLTTNFFPLTDQSQRFPHPVDQSYCPGYSDTEDETFGVDLDDKARSTSLTAEAEARLAPPINATEDQSSTNQGSFFRVENQPELNPTTNIYPTLDPQVKPTCDVYDTGQLTTRSKGTELQSKGLLSESIDSDNTIQVSGATIQCENGHSVHTPENGVAANGHQTKDSVKTNERHRTANGVASNGNTVENGHSKNGIPKDDSENRSVHEPLHVNTYNSRTARNRLFGHIPLQSSPAPVKKSGKRDFGYDPDLNNLKNIKSAISCSSLVDSSDAQDSTSTNSDRKNLTLSSSAPTLSSLKFNTNICSNNSSSLLGNFEESLLNGRIEPDGFVEGYTVEIGASGSFCPEHVSLPVQAYFFNGFSDDNAPSPYLGYVDLSYVGRRGYQIPRRGTLQITLYYPTRKVNKMFVVSYDLTDMPGRSQTFLRQKTVYAPCREQVEKSGGRKLPTFLRYLIHLRFRSTKHDKVYLHTDIRLIYARDKFEFDSRVAAYEMRSYIEAPTQPKYSPIK